MRYCIAKAINCIKHIGGRCVTHTSGISKYAMKKTLFTASLACLAVLAFAAKKTDDPVLMTVNGKPVHKSEFEYLYHKNNTQQLQPQTVDEYMKMFVDYKLKVADAEANGLDTLKSFVDEFDKYRADLAKPYMTDSTVYNDLVREAYDHAANEVKVSHIMFAPAQNADEAKRQEALADSVRNVALGGADWNDLAARFSVDRGTSMNGGSMGWLPAGRFPWPFEKASYDTPVGGISPVINSGFGYHIIRVDEKRPSRGEVRASHILRLTMNKSAEEQVLAKQQIDSIYNVLKGGANFAEVAKTASEDGSAQAGGDLGWFGSGMMVPEFETAAFSLPTDSICEPFQTRFGWHIVKNTGHRPVKSLDELKPEIETMIQNSERGIQPEQAFLDKVMKEYDSKILPDGIERVKALIAKNAGGYDSVAIAALRVSDIPVLEINGKKLPVSKVMDHVAVTMDKTVDGGMVVINKALNDLLPYETAAEYRDNLADVNADYRNLVNEYRDGILLFDISNRRVWEAATKDKKGLEEYFKAHKDNYKWEKPKYKGFIVFAPNDSTATAARQYAEGLILELDPSTFAEKMRKEFGRKIRVERIIAAQGDNPISDYLFFNGPAPDTSKLSWPSFFGYAGHLATQPEEAIDVRGAVTTDYQNALEAAWLDEIRKAYPVKINKKVAKSLK